MTRSLAKDPARRCLTPAEWPPVDRERWLAALQPGDLLEPGGSRARFRPATNHKVRAGYGRWLAGLQHRGGLDAAAEPGSRITPAAVGAWLAEMQQVNATLTQISRLEELYQAAQVMDPSTDWGWLRRLAGRVRARHQPVRDKRARLVGAEDLFALGCDLMARASGTLRQRAVQYRDGLAIALLSARPLRRRNLAGLTLGTSLVQRDAAWWIVLTAAETKTHAPLEMPWPEALIPMLETWLAVHRPTLASLQGRWHRPAGDALWLSADGSPMTGMALYDRIVAATKAAFGQGINPHLFRDCAATSIAIDDPAQIGIASQLLGHRSQATTERYYNQAHSLEAARSVQANLVRLRHGPRLPLDAVEDFG